MGIQIGAKPDAGFDDPIGMLKDCHRRIEQFLHVLCLVVERAPGRALTDEEANAVKSALNYFRVGGQRHAADEEESLFPRMRADERTASALKEIETLETDHRQADDLHAAVEKLYTSWLEGGALSPEELEQLRAATERLKQLYDGHIRVEENLVFPRAAEGLDREALAEIGQEFRARRS
ncbi:hemerythrin domain-containing protein [Occallatibacter savannae]|uniref:hemerythrin domain-containing protein n=1 Tax=Occallatibacter savannae TaxID=1002691 RepID=UPI000D691535|nr:hemerythrin domain-containing protein [Occallatibacter savannae]